MQLSPGRGDCFLLLVCLVCGGGGGGHLCFCILTTELMFFGHRMPHSVPAAPEGHELAHGRCHPEVGELGKQGSDVGMRLSSALGGAFPDASVFLIMVMESSV